MISRSYSGDLDIWELCGNLMGTHKDLFSHMR